MLETLINLDKSLFVFLNQHLSNALFDSIFPVLTDWDKTIIGRLLLVLSFSFLIWKDNRKNLALIILLILSILITDQMSSSVIKPIVARLRPCHLINGTPVIEHLRLLVSCGAGFSFPSSHASNSFAAATLLTIFYPKSGWVFIPFAILVCFSRIYIGVHFPFDVIGGAILGIIFSLSLYALWVLFQKKYFMDKNGTD
jgi:undecaprenyl-diphosphatase